MKVTLVAAPQKHAAWVLARLTHVLCATCAWQDKVAAAGLVVPATMQPDGDVDAVLTRYLRARKCASCLPRPLLLSCPSISQMDPRVCCCPVFAQDSDERLAK